MYVRLISRRLYTLCLMTAIAAALMWLGSGVALAQFGGGGGGGGGFGGGGGTGGGTTATGPFSGVAVDAQGVLSLHTIQDPTGRLLQQRAKQAFSSLENDVAKQSDLRKISLTRLERAVQKRLADGDALDETMLHLAGLTRIEYVFCYPTTGDIVIAGPAEPWGEAPSGRRQGIITGRPIVELADLVVALRCFPPSGDKTPMVHCSIDPTQEGLARMQQFLRNVRGPSRVGDMEFTRYVVNGQRTSLGLQEITIGGVSANTHFAQVLVEADYRMKLIGIGLERPPIKMLSWVDKVNPAAVSQNALQRWWFVPNYECVRASEDGLAMQIVGDGVKLVGEDEVVDRGGTRHRAGKSNRASNLFVNAFTKKYGKLSEVSPVFGQLRNCIDMLVAAAFIQESGYYDEANWEMTTFGDEESFAVETESAPQKVATAINAIWKGNRLMTPIGGGVQIEAKEALSPANVLEDEKGDVATARNALDLKSLPAEQWWWD